MTMPAKAVVTGSKRTCVADVLKDSKVAEETRFKCVVCGKLTSGRISRGLCDDGYFAVGDTSARFPRRHKGTDGNSCPGNILEAEWVDSRIEPKIGEHKFRY